MVKPIKEGLYENVTMEEYHSSTGLGISCSKLTGFYRDPKGYVMKNSAGIKQTENAAMKKGTAFHLSLEDFQLFLATYIPLQTARLTAKALTDFYAKHPGKMPIRQVDFDKVIEMRKCFLNLPANQQILKQDRYNEASIYWQDEETGLFLKCRPDTMTKDFKIAVNYKTVDPYHLNNFSAHMSNLFYHVSAAMTMTGIEKVTGVKPEKYLLMCVTGKEPLKAFNVPITETVRIEGEMLFREMLNLYADYLANPMKYQTNDELIIDSLPISRAQNQRLKADIPPSNSTEYENPFFIPSFEREI